MLVIEEEVGSVEDVTLVAVAIEEELDDVSWEDEVWLDVVDELRAVIEALGMPRSTPTVSFCMSMKARERGVCHSSPRYLTVSL